MMFLSTSNKWQLTSSFFTRNSPLFLPEKCLYLIHFRSTL